MSLTSCGDNLKVDASSTSAKGCILRIHGDCSGKDLSGLDLSNINLTGMNFKNANLSDTTFDGSNLTHANFSGANLTRTSMVNVNARSTIFLNAKIRGISIYRSDFSLAKFIKANGSGLMIDDSNFENADFTYSDITFNDLQTSYFCKAVLSDGFLAEEGRCNFKLKP